MGNRLQAQRRPGGFGGLTGACVFKVFSKACVSRFLEVSSSSSSSSTTLVVVAVVVVVVVVVVLVVVVVVASWEEAAAP